MAALVIVLVGTVQQVMLGVPVCVPVCVPVPGVLRDVAAAAARLCHTTTPAHTMSLILSSPWRSCLYQSCSHSRSGNNLVCYLPQLVLMVPEHNV